MFEQRLREQRERHDGGNRWIGTGGTSPFRDRGGTHPTPEMRVGSSGGAQCDGDREINVCSRSIDARDVVLDVRQIDVALRSLRRLGREGAEEEELDLDETVDETCRNAGELEVVFRPPRRNRVKVVLLMDVGGSMDPHAELVSRLFTAASRSGRFARFRSYYFHNCVYNAVYEVPHVSPKSVPVADLLATSDRDEKLVVVGDALMRPAELTRSGQLDVSLRAGARRQGSSGCGGSRITFAAPAWREPRAGAVLDRDHDQRGDRERAADVGAEPRWARGIGALPRARRREAAGCGDIEKPLIRSAEARSLAEPGAADKDHCCVSGRGML